MSQKKSLHDLTNSLIQNGMEDYDSCVMLAVKDEKVVFAGGLQGGEDHISPSCVRLAIALHDFLNGELKKADAIASMFEKLDKMHDIVSKLKKMSAMGADNRTTSSEEEPDLDDMTKDMLDAILRNTFGGDKA